MATYFWVVGDTSLSDFSIAYSMRSQKVPPSRRHEAKGRIVQLPAPLRRPLLRLWTAVLEQLECL
jgi:hypothetical protein